MRVLSGGSPEAQLQREIISRCALALEAGAVKRNGLRSKDDFGAWRENIVRTINSAFPRILFERGKPPEARVVSAYEFDDYRIENVLFGSLPGWEVNGTVYLPKKPGIYPGVVCPTGHSSKAREDYQISAQVIARNGYVAISFDPPGCDGELAYLNDHFTNGVIGYLTGIWSNNHFVADAIRSVDYLESRDDVDKDLGITATGVSGGGATAIYASMCDDRIKFLAPVCCLAEHRSIHLTDLYTSCPEQFGPGFIENGIDYVELIAAQAPKPCLILGGGLDEVFDANSTKRLYGEIKNIYRLNGAEDRLGLFIQEDSGHAYTLDMANTVVGYMNRIIKGQDMRPLDIKKSDLRMLPADKLSCHPSNAANMFTVNRAEGMRLEKTRSFPDNVKKIDYLQERSRELLGLENEAGHPVAINEEQDPPVRWAHQLQKIDIEIKDQVHVPALLYKRRISLCSPADNRKRPALLFIDEEGKWKGFYHSDYLARAGRFLQREDEEREPLILSIDASGFGEMKAQPAAYDMAAWNDIERILSYLSISAGMPIMGLRTRDALCALNYLKSREDVDPEHVTVAGRGVGAIAALYAALFSGGVEKLILWDMLVNYRAMTVSFPFEWPQSIIIPGILKYYDLQDIVSEARCSEKIIIDPRDARRKMVSREKAEKIYTDKVKIYAGLEEDEAKDVFVSQILGHG